MSTQNLLAQYDLSMRLRARETQRPIQRSSRGRVQPTAVSMGTLLSVWTEGGRLLCRSMPNDPAQLAPSPTPVTVALLTRATEAINDGGPMQVVTDTPSTLNALIAQVGREARDAPYGEWEARKVWSVLTYTKSLAWSQRVFALTAALTQTYYVDPSLNTDSLADWCQALDLTAGESTPARMLELVRFLANVESPCDDGRMERYRSAADSAEKRGIASSQYGGLRSSTSAFKAAQQHGDAVEAMLALDPLLIARNLIERRIAQVQVTLQAERSLGVTLPDTFGIREGRQVLMMYPDGLSADGRLSRVELRERNGQMVMEATIAGKSRGAAFGAMTGKVLRDLYVFEEPFLPRTRGQGKRWMLTAEARAAQGEYQAPAKRQVPLEVVLAGAPVID